MSLNFECMDLYVKLMTVMVKFIFTLFTINLHAGSFKSNSFLLPKIHVVILGEKYIIASSGNRTHDPCNLLPADSHLFLYEHLIGNWNN